MKENTTQRYYGVLHQDDTRYFGPFDSTEEAEDATWMASITSGYDGASSEVITESEYERLKSGNHSR